MRHMIEGRITLTASIALDDGVDLLVLGELVPSAKKQLLYKIKRDLFDKAESLTLDDIKFSASTMPKSVVIDGSTGGKDE